MKRPGQNGNRCKAQKALLSSVLIVLASAGCLAQGVLGAGPELVLQTGHNRGVNALAFSPDGRWLASAMNDKSFKVWEVKTGFEVRTLSGHSGEIKALAFSPDGKLIASGADDRTIVLWDSPSGRAVGTLSGHTGGIRALSFSPDGRTLASGGADPQVLLWNIATGRQIRMLSAVAVVHALSFSADGRLLAWGSDGNFVKICEVSTGRELQSISAHEGPVDGVAFSPDGHSLTSEGGLDATAKVWDVASGRRLRTVPTEGLGAGYAAISNDGNWVAVQSRDNGVEAILVGLKEGTQARSLPGGGASTMAFSHDGQIIATGSGNGTIGLWDVATGRPLRTLFGHTEFVWAVAFSRDGRYLATGGLDNTARLWDLATGRPVRTFRGHTGYVVTVAFSPDSRWLASGSADSHIKLWDVATGRELTTLTGHTNQVTSLSFSADGRFLLSGSWDGTVRQWNLMTGLSQASPSTHQLVGAVAFSPDGRWLAAAFLSGVAVREITTGRNLFPATRQNFTVSSLAFSPDGRRLASASGDHTVKVWDMPSGRELYTLTGHGDWVHAVAFSPDGRWLASGAADHTVKFWDASTGRELRTLVGHTHDVHGIAFSPDGKWLASASSDGSTRIWDAATGEQVAALVSLSHDGGWVSVAPDGLFDGTADAMQVAAAWRAADSNETLPLDAFFTDFYYPGLLGDIMAGSRPKARVDIATAIQVPGLRPMLAAKLAHMENHDGQLVVCFEQKPGAVLNVGPTDQRGFFPPVNGYKPGSTPTCKFEKALPALDTNPGVQVSQLKEWAPDTVATAWDGKISETARSRLHVLTVAVSQYPSDSGFDPLPYAVPSSRAIEAFFRAEQTSRTAPYKTVRVWDGLSDRNATRDGVRQRFADMAKDVTEDDVVLIYLAGHGKVSLGEEMFYFVPVDGRDADLRGTALSTAMIAEGLQNLPARRVVLIVDACQSGGAIEALSKIGAVKARAQQRRAPNGEAGRVSDAGVGVHLIAATLPLSYAIGLREGESVLAETIEKALRQGTTARQLTAYVRDRLPTESAQITHGFRQVPLTDSIGLDFALASK